MKNKVTKPVLAKLLLITIFLMPCLIILEVLPTAKAIISMVLAIIGGSIYYWGYKGGLFCAVYSSLMTLGLLLFAPWTTTSYEPFMVITLYLFTGIVGGKIATSCHDLFHDVARTSCNDRPLIKKNAYVTGGVSLMSELTKEVRQAKTDLAIARQNFQYAEEENIDVAILKLNCAIEKHDRLMQNLKSEPVSAKLKHRGIRWRVYST